MDDQLPTIVISDSPATGSIGADFVWLAKVSTTSDCLVGFTVLQNLPAAFNLGLHTYTMEPSSNQDNLGTEESVLISEVS